MGQSLQKWRFIEGPEAINLCDDLLDISLSGSWPPSCDEHPLEVRNQLFQYSHTGKLASDEGHSSNTSSSTSTPRKKKKAKGSLERAKELVYTYECINCEECLLINIPEIIKVIIELIGKSIGKIENFIIKQILLKLNFITKILSENQRRLCSVGIVQSIFNFYQSILVQPCKLQLLLLEFIKILATFHISLVELYKYFQLFSPDGFSSNILSTLVDICRNQTIIPSYYLQFPNYDSSIEFSLSSRAWPPPNGYALCMWICFDRFYDETHRQSTPPLHHAYQTQSAAAQLSPKSPNTNTGREGYTQTGQLRVGNKLLPYTIISLSPDVNNMIGSTISIEIKYHSIILAIVSKESRMECTLNDDSTKHEFMFTTKRWYHVILSHSPTVTNERTNKKQMKRNAKIYINGKKASYSTLAYPKSVTTGKVTCMFGCKQKINANNIQLKSIRKFPQWNLGTVYLLEEPPTDNEAFLLYQLGPNYCGNLDINLSYFYNPYSVIHVDNFKLFGKDPSKLAILTDPWSTQLTYLQEKIIYVFSPRNFIYAQSIKIPTGVPSVTQSTTSSSGTALAPASVNKTSDHLLISRSIVRETLSNIGGISIIIFLIAMLEDPLQRNYSLELLYNLIHHSPMNGKELNGLCGYELIARLMRKNNWVIDEELLRILFEFVGFTQDPRTTNYACGVLSNLYAFKGLIMDWRIWKLANRECLILLFNSLLEIIDVNTTLSPANLFTYTPPPTTPTRTNTTSVSNINLSAINANNPNNTSITLSPFSVTATHNDELKYKEFNLMRFREVKMLSSLLLFFQNEFQFIQSNLYVAPACVSIIRLLMDKEPSVSDFTLLSNYLISTYVPYDGSVDYNEIQSYLQSQPAKKPTFLPPRDLNDDEDTHQDDSMSDYEKSLRKRLLKKRMFNKSKENVERKEKKEGEQEDKDAENVREKHHKRYFTYTIRDYVLEMLLDIISLPYIHITTNNSPQSQHHQPSINEPLMNPSYEKTITNFLKVFKLETILSLIRCDSVPTRILLLKILNIMLKQKEVAIKFNKIHGYQIIGEIISQLYPITEDLFTILFCILLGSRTDHIVVNQSAKSTHPSGTNASQSAGEGAQPQAPSLSTTPPNRKRMRAYSTSAIRSSIVSEVNSSVSLIHPQMIQTIIIVASGKYCPSDISYFAIKTLHDLFLQNDLVKISFIDNKLLQFLCESFFIDFKHRVEDRKNKQAKEAAARTDNNGDDKATKNQQAEGNHLDQSPNSTASARNNNKKQMEEHVLLFIKAITITVLYGTNHRVRIFESILHYFLLLQSLPQRYIMSLQQRVIYDILAFFHENDFSTKQKYKKTYVELCKYAVSIHRWYGIDIIALLHKSMILPQYRDTIGPLDFQFNNQQQQNKIKQNLDYEDEDWVYLFDSCLMNELDYYQAIFIILSKPFNKQPFDIIHESDEIHHSLKYLILWLIRSNLPSHQFTYKNTTTTTGLDSSTSLNPYDDGMMTTSGNNNGTMDISGTSTIPLLSTTEIVLSSSNDFTNIGYLESKPKPSDNMDIFDDDYLYYSSSNRPNTSVKSLSKSTNQLTTSVSRIASSGRSSNPLLRSVEGAAALEESRADSGNSNGNDNEVEREGEEDGGEEMHEDGGMGPSVFKKRLSLHDIDIDDIEVEVIEFNDDELKLSLNDIRSKSTEEDNLLMKTLIEDKPFTNTSFRTSVIFSQSVLAHLRLDQQQNFTPPVSPSKYDPIQNSNCMFFYLPPSLLTPLSLFFLYFPSIPLKYHYSSFLSPPLFLTPLSPFYL